MPRRLPVLRVRSSFASPAGGKVLQMGERDAAQAYQLIRAVCHERDKMTRQLSWVEKHASRREAAALRRDLDEAQIHINRLQRRYLGQDGRTSVPQRA
jgi:hypothetical protein